MGAKFGVAIAASANEIIALSVSRVWTRIVARRLLRGHETRELLRGHETREYSRARRAV